jgi:hypothetical protein
VHGSSQSPQKNFNIKKVIEFKHKVMLSAQKAAELQLKRQEQECRLSSPPSPLKGTFLHKQSIDRVLVSGKCSISRELPRPSLQELLLEDSALEDGVFNRKPSTKRTKDLNILLHL